MTHFTLLAFIFGLGLRHGFDPDHLSVIDNLCCVHPSRLAGVWFALGHGLSVTALAIGVGHIPVRTIEPYAPWMLMAMGAASLWRLRKPVTHSHGLARQLTGNPLLLGILFGMGVESASQLSALVLASTLNPWLLGCIFSAGVMAVDGMDGYLAARTRLAAKAGSRKRRAIRTASLSCLEFGFFRPGRSGIAQAEH